MNRSFQNMIRQYVIVAFYGCMLFCLPSSGVAGEAGSGGVFLPVSRAELIVVPKDIAQILIADPSVVDVHVIGTRRVALIGKSVGHTNAKLFDSNNKVIRQFDVIVGYDLPAIRKALHFFLPHERIMVSLVNANIALTGEVSDASVADKAVRIVNQFTQVASSVGTTGGGVGAGAGAGNAAANSLSGGASGGGGGASGSTGGATATTSASNGDTSAILNLLRVATGQQVMLRVRVGEIQRTAVKTLGSSLAFLGNNNKILGTTNSKIANFESSGTSTSTSATGGPGSGSVQGLTITGNNYGVLDGMITFGGQQLGAALEAYEQDGLLRILAEPDLVAMSGEKAEFLAGGQFPIETALSTGGGTIPSISYQSYGVAVQFVPTVLAENRIRILVQPEVSEIDTSQQFQATAGQAPALLTRRAKTTVELSPGESFMIAGLMNDSTSSSLSQMPGASSVPILGALFRSTAFQRQETELVIAVTPYLVDPLKSSDVRLPSDDFRPATFLEQFFYGALGSTTGEEFKKAQMPSAEGPIGFITD